MLTDIIQDPTQAVRCAESQRTAQNLLRSAYNFLFGLYERDLIPIFSRN